MLHKLFSLILLIFLFVACKSLTSVESSEKSLLDDKKQLWANVCVPIIRKDKETVTDLFPFPLDRHFLLIAEILNKPLLEISRDDFTSNFDEIFNDDFLRSLKTQSHKDIQTHSVGEYKWFVISLERKIGQTEAGINLKFYKDGDVFILDSFEAVGADFYYREK